MLSISENILSSLHIIVGLAAVALFSLFYGSFFGLGSSLLFLFINLIINKQKIS